MEVLDTIATVFGVLGFVGSMALLPFLIHQLVEERVAKRIERYKEDPAAPFVVPERHPDGTIDYHVHLREGIVVFRLREEGVAEDPYKPEVVSVSDNISYKNEGK